MIAEMAPALVQLAAMGWLQWGRDQLIAEIVLWCGNARQGRSLQWGRDQLIAEIASPLSYSVFKDPEDLFRVGIANRRLRAALQPTLPANYLIPHNFAPASASRTSAAAPPLAARFIAS